MFLLQGKGGTLDYLIYTDGACDHVRKRVASSFYIQTNSRFISLGGRCFRGKNIAKAETIAIGLGIERLLKQVELKQEDTVTIFTDCLSVLDFFKNVRDTEAVPGSNDPGVKLVWKYLKALECKCNWSFKKIRAHQNVVNGNAVADRLAKYVLSHGGVI